MQNNFSCSGRGVVTMGGAAGGVTGALSLSRTRVKVPCCGVSMSRGRKPTPQGLFYVRTAAGEGGGVRGRGNSWAGEGVTLRGTGVAPGAEACVWNANPGYPERCVGWRETDPGIKVSCFWWRYWERADLARSRHSVCRGGVAPSPRVRQAGRRMY